MPKLNETVYVAVQYADAGNLTVRTGLHHKHSTNRQGFFPWLWEQYAFREGDRILELGCGAGAQWEGRAGSLPARCSLTLSDFSPGMVEAARQNFGHFSHVAFERIDIQRIPHPDCSFDAVIANHMLYHVPDLSAAIAEVHRVLRPGGRFYAATNGDGGMYPFLRGAILCVDPAATAFADRLPFSLQNGGKMLRRRFPLVRRVDYADSLAVTDTADLVAWVRSNISAAHYTDGDFEALYAILEAIRLRDGAIRIDKEVGLFIAQK